MLLGRVIGTVWATEKDEKLEGMKLLVVRAVDLDYEEKESFVVAVDTVQAGVGEIVLVSQGSAARQTRQTHKKPVDAVIMAVVDSLEVQSEKDLKAEYDSRQGPIASAVDAVPEA